MGKKHWLQLEGKNFGRWHVLSRLGAMRQNGPVYWLCRCECGTEQAVIAATLTNGRSKSCGCYSDERKRTHSKSRTPTYQSWRAMLKRCYLKSHDQYANYGGRGIKVCESWHKFENFYADMGERPDGMSIERIDNDADYGPDNCRWATQTEQIRNKRNTALIEYQGKTRPLAEVCEQLGIPLKRTRNRIAAGWPLEDALLPDKQSRWHR